MVLQKNCSFFLNEGDVLKLGKMIVSIKEIVLHKDPEEYTMMETKIVDNNFMTELAEVRSSKYIIIKPVVEYQRKQELHHAEYVLIATIVKMIL